MLLLFFLIQIIVYQTQNNTHVVHLVLMVGGEITVHKLLTNSHKLNN